MPAGPLGRIRDARRRVGERLRPRGRRYASLESRLVWIFGSPRTGSTWVLNLLAAHEGVVKIDEPGIGLHLGVMVPQLHSVDPQQVPADRFLVSDAQRDRHDYFFSRRFEHAWRPLVRDLILGRIDAQVKHLGPGGPKREPLVALKEPHGSQAAPLVMSTLRRSRLLFLVRDGRDVLDSALDAVTGGQQWVARYGLVRDMDEEERLAFLTRGARIWLFRTEAVQRAYADLPGHRRMLVRYEDLLADTPAALVGLLRWLGLGVTEDEARKTAVRLSFEALPADRKGPGKFARSASPGAWRTNLSNREQRVIDDLLGPKLEELGYERS